MFMLDCLKPLFFNGLMMYWHSSLWMLGLARAEITSNLLIALFYYFVFILLVYFVGQQRDFPYAGIFMLFGAVTFASGTTHLMDIWTLWHPNDSLAEGIEATIAVIALLTALLSVRLLPKVLGQARSRHPEATNQSHVSEIPTRTHPSQLATEELGVAEPNPAKAYALNPAEIYQLKAEL